MKVRRFLFVIIAVAVTVGTLTLSSGILWESYVIRGGGMSSPRSAGAYAIYFFEAVNVRYSAHSQYTYASPVGSLLCNVIGNNLAFRETIQNPETPGAPPLTENWTVLPSSAFAEALYAPGSWSPGQVVSLDSLISSIGSASYPYFVVYTGTVAGREPTTSFIGQTDPYGLHPLNPNETGINQSFARSLGPLEFDYDVAGGFNVLVQYSFSGNSTFVSQVFRGLPLTNVTGFLMDLVATNIILGPLDWGFYFQQTALYTAASLVVILVPTVMIYRRARIRNSTEKRKAPTTH